MKQPLCPICQSKSAPFFAKNLPLFRCFSCQLNFQTLSKKEEFTPNERIWGENDPRLSEATYQMKKQTFKLFFRELEKFTLSLPKGRNLFKEIKKIGAADANRYIYSKLQERKESRSFWKDRLPNFAKLHFLSANDPERTKSAVSEQNLKLSQNFGRLADDTPGGADERQDPSDRKRPTLLDIGTGTGALLETASEFGFNTIGLEPDKKFVEAAAEIRRSPEPVEGRRRTQNVKILYSTLEKVDLSPNSFDIITMFDVLEHMRDLNSTLQKISLILKPSGLLVISTPDTNSLSFKLMGKNWPHFKKEHIYYFSQKSLTILLSKYNITPLPLPKSRLGGTKGGLKSLNLSYIAGYFTAFPTPILSPLSHFLVNFLPKSITQLPIFLPNGNMLIIAIKNK